MNGKFRVWDEDTHEYHRGDFSITQDGKVWLFVDEDNPPMECPSDNYIVEYSTGLKDKNGKEIYEGDIITGLGYGQRGLIVWRDGGFGFMYEAKTQLQKELSRGEDWYDFVPFSRHGHLEEILGRFEIIGNIHEGKK